MNKQPLLTTYNLSGTELANRMVMAPMTRSRAGEGNVPTDLMAKYYRQRSSAGLIISEGTQISQQGIGYPWTPGIHTDEQVEGWKKVTKAVHEKDGKIFAQIWHVGRVSHPRYHNGEPPVAPSAVKPEGQIFTADGMKDFVTPRALKTDEIPGIIEDYVQAARNAIKAGFDGVEIHGANGYLIDQFLKDGTNKRTDEYGGSLKNRIRFAIEVVDAVVNAIGAGKTGIRFSPAGRNQGISDSNPKETFCYLLEQLNDFNLAYVHLMEPMNDVSDLNNYPTEVTKYFREIYEGTIITNVGYDKESGNKAIKDGIADLLAYGRPFIANPDLPARFAAGAELNEPDQSTFYGGGEEGYTDYPFLNESAEVAAE
ncbi:alkene reductase [Aliifodinibius salipaludis]|uniref:Alkene reductase n=1 Tax=Fodinibius salipaludis TaxID=2032627 RepID=A0A2A2GAX3_9BACT|nr:alkene reductase [Aliifodinibius salipaludis]PAU94886.1 alkene reductase [Aliifodinibius salipaludis]